MSKISFFLSCRVKPSESLSAASWGCSRCSSWATMTTTRKTKKKKKEPAATRRRQIRPNKPLQLHVTVTPTDWTLMSPLKLSIYSVMSVCPPARAAFTPPQSQTLSNFTGSWILAAPQLWFQLLLTHRAAVSSLCLLTQHVSFITGRIHLRIMSKDGRIFIARCVDFSFNAGEKHNVCKLPV